MAQFTITIPDGQLSNFARDFLIAKPIPLDENGVPLYTAQQWIRVNVRDYLNEIRHQGLMMTYSRTVSDNRPPRVDDAS